MTAAFVPAGARDRLVTIEKSTQSQGVGEPVRSWSTHATWWTRRRRLGAQESPAGGQEQFGVVQDEWDGLFIPGVTTDMRINDGGVLYDIDDVDDTGQRENVLRLVTTLRSA